MKLTYLTRSLSAYLPRMSSNPSFPSNLSIAYKSAESPMPTTINDSGNLAASTIEIKV